MATIFKETFTKPLPAGAELFTRKGQQFARWTDGRGRAQTGKVTVPKDGKHAGQVRIVQESGTYTAKYRDGTGLICKVTTGCRDEVAARNVLAELVKRRELVKGKILTPAQDAVIDHQDTPIGGHIAAYVAHLTAKGVTPGRVAQTESRLRRVFGECQVVRLNGLDGQAVERWLSARAANRMSAAARNGYRSACVAFGNWCVADRRLVVNPMSRIPKADEKADPRRHRRALSEDELLALLDVARRRPLLDTATVRRGKRKGQAAAKLRPETIARLDMLGRERALIYKTLVLTGLRKGELASLTVGQLDLDGPTPYAVLHAADEKNRQGSRIALRADVATDLRAWLADRLAPTQDDARRQGQPIPARMDDGAPLFTVPAGLVRILDRDLVLAGIARRVKDPKTGKLRIDKRDGRGWTVDVHALRHTFGTLLSKGNVAPRTAQAAMRHSSIDLTMNVYTDPRLLDVAGALNALPLLPLDNAKDAQELRKTGTTGGPDGPEKTYEKPKSAPQTREKEPADGEQRTCASTSLVPIPVPASYKSGILQSNAGKTGSGGHWPADREKRSETLENRGFRQPSATADKPKQIGHDRARTCDLILVRDAL